MWLVSLRLFKLFQYRIVCGKCSKNKDYAPGYTDKKVRMCGSCYKEILAYKVSAHNVN